MKLIERLKSIYRILTVKSYELFTPVKDTKFPDEKILAPIFLYKDSIIINLDISGKDIPLETIKTLKEYVFKLERENKGVTEGLNPPLPKVLVEIQNVGKIDCRYMNINYEFFVELSYFEVEDLIRIFNKELCKRKEKNILAYSEERIDALMKKWEEENAKNAP